MVPAPRPVNTDSLSKPNVRARKRALVVAQRIVDQIIRSGSPPGTKLASEAAMISEFGVSRGTLRESLRYLELNGVVAIKPGPGGGPIVTEPDGQDLAGALGLFLQVLRAPFTSIAAVRDALEPMIAAMAATRIRDDELAVIRASLEEMEEAIDDTERFLEKNREFHELVAAASANRFFSVLISSLHHVIDGTLLGVSYPHRQREAMLAAHRTILGRLEARDPEGAQRAMKLHMDEYQTYLQRKYPDVASSLVRWRDIAP